MSKTTYLDFIAKLPCFIGWHIWRYNTAIRLEYQTPGDPPTKIRSVRSASLTRKCSCCGKEQVLPGTYTH